MSLPSAEKGKLSHLENKSWNSEAKLNIYHWCSSFIKSIIKIKSRNCKSKIKSMNCKSKIRNMGCKSKLKSIDCKSKMNCSVSCESKVKIMN